MRKLITLTMLAATLLLIQSCTKQSHDDMGIKEAEVEIVNAIVSEANPYILTVNHLGTVTIGKQASFYQVSETVLSGEAGTPVYKYIPKAGFRGSDEVELIGSKLADRGAAGCGFGNGLATTSKHSKISRVLIKFTVTD